MVESGAATISDAAAKLGVTRSTAYLWVRSAASGSGTALARPRVKVAVPSEPTFVRVVPSAASGAAITLRVGAAEIHVQRGFAPDVLRAVVEALGGAA